MSTHKGHLFKPSGKWKYDVELDYSLAGLVDDGGSIRRESDGRWVDPGEAAQLALAASTDAGISGVTIRELGHYWTLVVIDPPNGYPILVLPPQRVAEGDRVRLEEAGSLTPWRALEPGDTGTVRFVDDEDIVYVAWDNGVRSGMKRGDEAWTVLR